MSAIRGSACSGYRKRRGGGCGRARSRLAFVAIMSSGVGDSDRRRAGDPAFAPPARLPFPPGTGPFRQKGNGYLGDLAYFEASVRGGSGAVIQALPDAALRAFHEQRFRGSEWYDAFPATALHSAAARLRGVAFAEHRRQVGAYHAREAGGGIYRTLLRVLSTDNVAVWAPRVSSIYFEFGKTKTSAVAPKDVAGVRSGLPEGLLQFVMFASKGFCEETLLLAGAKTASFDLGAVRIDDRAHGQDLYSVDFFIRWT